MFKKTQKTLWGVPVKLKPTVNPTDEQIAFADATTCHCMVVAIPGSGKSTAIIAKMHKLLDLGQSVIGVTFTNEAAEDLRKQSSFDELDPDRKSRCRIGTFHSLVKRELEALPGSPLSGRKLMSDGETEIQRTKALEACGVEATDDTLKWFETAYSRVTDRFGLDAALGMDASDPKRAPAIALAEKKMEVLQVYEARLADLVVFDLGRLLLTALEFMDHGHRLLVADNVMVDEFQDVDEVQLHLVLRLAEWSRIDVVGDDDQSIYGFRAGMGYQAFQQLEAALKPKPEPMAFTLNFRCRSEILAWARVVIEENRKRIYKALTPWRGPGSLCRLISFDYQPQEHAVVRELVLKALEDGAQTVAIAAAKRKALIAIQAELTGRVDFRRADVESFWDQPETSIAVSLLRAIDDPNGHPIGLENALHAHGVHGSELKIIRALAAGRRIYTGFHKAQEDEAISDNTREAMEWLEELLIDVGFAHPTRDEVHVDFVIQATLDGVIRAIAVNPRLKDWQRELMSKRLAIARRVLLGLRGSLRARLDVVSRSLEKQEDAPVTLLTLHGSKGLQFDVVFIIDASERQMPRTSTDPAASEEVRRLLYVGMTRARDALTITCSRWGLSSRGKPTYMTGLLNVKGSPWEERGEDYFWMLRT